MQHTLNPRASDLCLVTQLHRESFNLMAPICFRCQVGLRDHVHRKGSRGFRTPGVCRRFRVRVQHLLTNGLFTVLTQLINPQVHKSCSVKVVSPVSYTPSPHRHSTRNNRFLTEGRDSVSQVINQWRIDFLKTSYHPRQENGIIKDFVLNITTGFIINIAMKDISYIKFYLYSH